MTVLFGPALLCLRLAMVQVDQEAAMNLVTDERKDALTCLIGVWKTGDPPTDDEVDSMLEQQRMAKYG